MHIKDNLMTKDNLTYEQCYQRLMDITTETEQDDKAYAVTLSRHKQWMVRRRLGLLPGEWTY